MDERRWNVAVIGASGAVGRTMVSCLAESGMPIASMRGFASPRSIGARIGGITIEPLEKERLEGCDLVLLSAGAEVSRAWVPWCAAQDMWTVDNSSAFRMHPDVPLIVPEVNADAIPEKRGAIANPNCSTIQMVVALAPLARRFGLRRVHVATYQSVSGRGQKGIDALSAERLGGAPVPGAFPHPIDRNVVPQVDVFLADGYTREEEKMVNETRRILRMPELPVHVTCVRVPVDVSHSEAVHVEFDGPVTREELVACLAAGPGIQVEDDPARERYPTPRAIAGRNDVWVGRIRQDRCDPRIAELWIVADNLRKGAAWNAVQIASLLHAHEASHAGLPTPPRV